MNVFEAGAADGTMFTLLDITDQLLRQDWDRLGQNLQDKIMRRAKRQHDEYHMQSEPKQPFAVPYLM